MKFRAGAVLEKPSKRVGSLSDDHKDEAYVCIRTGVRPWGQGEEHSSAAEDEAAFFIFQTSNQKLPITLL